MIYMGYKTNLLREDQWKGGFHLFVIHKCAIMGLEQLSLSLEAFSP